MNVWTRTQGAKLGAKVPLDVSGVAAVELLLVIGKVRSLRHA